MICRKSTLFIITLFVDGAQPPPFIFTVIVAHVVHILKFGYNRIKLYNEEAIHVFIVHMDIIFYFIHYNIFLPFLPFRVLSNSLMSRCTLFYQFFCMQSKYSNWDICPGELQAFHCPSNHLDMHDLKFTSANGHFEVRSSCLLGSNFIKIFSVDPQFCSSTPIFPIDRVLIQYFFYGSY